MEAPYFSVSEQNLHVRGGGYSEIEFLCHKDSFVY